ncbi:MAG TPA: hypothetical protein VNJ52_00125 [Patescibacteria group bacterium]|nr:hypothetical protein [Patescibacteria group bacterium]
MSKRKKARQKVKKGLDRSKKNRPLGKRKGGLAGKKPRGNRPPVQSGEFAFAPPLVWMPGPSEPARRKRGRPTVPDNILLGSRNRWLSLYEEFWPEIGFNLLEIRKRKGGTIEDVRKVFEPIRGRVCGDLASAFLQGSPREVDGKTLRADRIRASKLRYEVQGKRDRRVGMERSCAEAESALAVAGEQEKEVIQAQANQRQERLSEFEEGLAQAETESKELDQRVENEEAYWYCSQLLDFLSKERYTVEPLRLANAMAGLPEMGWRESSDRCSKMTRSSAFGHFHYRVFEAVSRIWRRRPKDIQDAPTEFFQPQILGLPKKDKWAREAFCRGWRDLRLAIEECWAAQHDDDFMPYAITSAFLRNQLRQKTEVERMLDDHEKLPKGQ